MKLVQEALRQKGYRIFDRPYELNIVGVRSDNNQPNRFDDSICVFYTDKEGRQQSHVFPATTDPGTYWLQNPMNPQGTAILKAGQYQDAYMMGMHQAKYMALVQRKSVVVLRDYDRNAILDFDNGIEEKGLFGINIHRAFQTGTTKTVDHYSAGCQVFANSADFIGFLTLCHRHRLLYDNMFTYTLIDERAVNREAKKNCFFPLAA